jgi:alcohol dehydrogenase class IV
VAKRRENVLWFGVLPKIYFKRCATDLALGELEGKECVFIVTDRFLFQFRSYLQYNQSFRRDKY